MRRLPEIYSGESADRKVCKLPIPGRTGNMILRLHQKNTVQQNQDFSYNMYSEKAKGLNVVKYGAVEVKYMVRTTILSLKELVSGKLGMKDLSGPVGVVDAIGTRMRKAKAKEP